MAMQNRNLPKKGSLLLFWHSSLVFIKFVGIIFDFEVLKIEVSGNLADKDICRIIKIMKDLIEWIYISKFCNTFI